LKRLFDIIFSFLCLVATLPLMILSILAIKLDSIGPIFFNSIRVGYNNKNFKMLKLRTMYEGTELIESNKIKNVNKKVTMTGKILRKYSIDELPQFISVIIGDMSVVGPRPALPSQKKIIIKRKKLGINLIKPGITGLAQINGRDKITESQKIKLDYEYLKKHNFSFDLKIILKTVFFTLKGKNISH